MLNFRRVFFGVITLATLGSFSFAAAAEKPPFYAVAERPTPVLNTADFPAVFGGADGKTLKKDPEGLIREVEFIALPGTVFKVAGEVRKSGALIYKVSTSGYPSPVGGLYIDSRFVRISSSPIKPRIKKLPPGKTILERMLKNEGATYVWGANYSGGIPELLRFYPPRGNISQKERELWTLKGLDCSGLLYEAANGATPRNTSDLISFGKPVFIEGLSAEEIASQLKPLDLIVWKGHVIIVLDKTRTIESCLKCSRRGGVTIRNLRTVLAEVMKTRTPVNDYSRNTHGSSKIFVVRRWYF